MRSLMRSSVCLVILLAAPVIAWGQVQDSSFVEGIPEDSFTILLEPIDTLHAVAVFAGFQDHLGDTVPDWYDAILDSSVDSSIVRFYIDNSFHHHLLTGESRSPFPFYYIAPESASFYPGNDHGAFNRDILAIADTTIDFSEFDCNGDNVVDFVFVIAPGGPWPWTGMSSLGDLGPEPGFQPTYYTNDTSAAGDTIMISTFNGSTQKIYVDYNGTVGTCAHEYFHRLTGPWPDGNKHLGVYSFGGHVTTHAINPAIKAELGWVTPIDVGISQFDVEIGDLFGSPNGMDVAYRFWIRPTGDYEYFLVTNHQGLSYWERHYPGKGLLVWHFDKSSPGQDNVYHKRVDLECADGLWTDSTKTQPDPVRGVDDLDLNLNQGNSTDFFTGFPGATFDAFSNPSSDGYNLAPFPQNIAYHSAVRNIQIDLEDSTLMLADFIVNRVESDVETATGENNGRRWVLDANGETMHMVYASKGHIYYTTTDQSKIWLPAIPIGEGSYPSLSLDTSGKPVVVWIQEGVCNVTPSKLLFSSKTDGIWGLPSTLLSIPEELGPPSFVIDTDDRGHVVYRVDFCDQNGNSAIYYGAFDTHAPGSLQTELLDASSSGCGNASVDHTTYLNSVHAVWEKERKIWYSWWEDPIGWHTAEDVSQAGNDRSETPSVDLMYDRVDVVWAFESIPGKDVILYRSRTVGGAWGQIASPSGTDLQTAKQPITVDGPGGLYALWSEIPTDGTQFEIYYAKSSPSGWQRQGNLSNTPATSSYPQALQRRPTSPHGRGRSSPDPIVVLEAIWTDGNSMPFHLANKKIYLEPPTLGGGPQSAGLRNTMPKAFALLDPYPSPFCESVVLRYQVPRATHVTLRIYDVTGRLVKTLINGQEAPGKHSLEWAGTDKSGTSVAPGVYFARVESGNFRASEKMILLR